MVSTLKNMLVNGDHHPICWMEHERSISSHQTLYHIINVSHPQLCWSCTPDKWLCECMCIFGNAYALRCCLSLVLVLPARLSYYIYRQIIYTSTSFGTSCPTRSVNCSVCSMNRPPFERKGSPFGARSLSLQHLRKVEDFMQLQGHLHEG